MKAIFTGDLRYPDTAQTGEREWTVEQPFVVENLDDDGNTVQTLIPIGFKTDYGSIPQCLWGIFDPIGSDAAAFINHDLSYGAELFRRSVCDWNLLRDLQEAGNHWLYRNTIYSHVRLYGGIVWGRHTSESVDQNRSLIASMRWKLSQVNNPYGIIYDPITGLYSKIA